MTKEECVSILKKNGFRVSNEKGILMFYYSDSYSEQIAKIKNALADLQYCCSYGIKYLPTTTSSSNISISDTNSGQMRFVLDNEEE